MKDNAFNMTLHCFVMLLDEYAFACDRLGISSSPEAAAIMQRMEMLRDSVEELADYYCRRR
ncbi:MAG: hypothetical protein IJM68_03800 [Synergistaceae bacterium]|nr:hypothetical protein [Synergistaceae bacterium]MBQ6664693.1 hypothetical protein [Synergistaceae bacterium]